MNKQFMGRTALVGFGLAITLGGAALMATRAHGGQKDANNPVGKITPWAAIKIATGKVPGKALNANFEFDEGHWVYGVMVVTNTTPKQIKEVEIDPMTGKIGDVEEITPDGEAKEMAAELNKALGKTVAKDAKEADEKDEKPEKK